MIIFITTVVIIIFVIVIAIIISSFSMAIKTLRLYQYLWWELWTAFNLFFWRFSFEVTLLYFALDNYFFCSVFFNIDLSCCWLSVFLFVISFHIDKASEKKRNIYDFQYILVSIPSCTKGSHPPFFGFPFFFFWDLGDSIACTILNEQRDEINSLVIGCMVNISVVIKIFIFSHFHRFCISVPPTLPLFKSKRTLSYSSLTTLVGHTPIRLLTLLSPWKFNLNGFRLCRTRENICKNSSSSFSNNTYWSSFFMGSPWLG